jgi:DNA-directed RNA polymerase subunit RPC12/RpoP
MSTPTYRCPKCTAPLRRALLGDGYECTDCGDTVANPAQQVWLMKDMVCAICSHEWAAQYPKEAKRLQCPGCSYMNPLTDEVWRG